MNTWKSLEPSELRGITHRAPCLYKYIASEKPSGEYPPLRIIVHSSRAFPPAKENAVQQTARLQITYNLLYTRQ